jgi:nucleoside-diphosphate-sugar epimerase
MRKSDDVQAGTGNILLTGAKGFLGAYLNSVLLSSGKVDTLGRSGATFNVDLSKTRPLLVKQYDLVVHSAGKAHSVPVTDMEKELFFDVNVKGTANLLNALEQSGNLPKAFVFISSVSVYGLETGTNIQEDQFLSATDPYGKSKIQAEELIASWCIKNQVVCSVLRLPLIVGEHAPGNLQSMIKGISKGYYFNIGGGKARKSMVLAQDVAELIMEVAPVGGIFNLTDGYHPSFFELSAAISSKLNKKTSPWNMPLGVARILGEFGDLLGRRAPVNSAKIKKITSDLTFNDDKARKLLNWRPTPVITGLKI